MKLFSCSIRKHCVREAKFCYCVVLRSQSGESSPPKAQYDCNALIRFCKNGKKYDTSRPFHAASLPPFGLDPMMSFDTNSENDRRQWNFPYLRNTEISQSLRCAMKFGTFSNVENTRHFANYLARATSSLTNRPLSSVHRWVATHCFPCSIYHLRCNYGSDIYCRICNFNLPALRTRRTRICL